MLKIDPAQLDYSTLVKQGKRKPESTAADAPPVRVALLGDCALQQFVPLLRALFAQALVTAEIFDGGFDTASTEAYDSTSTLYAFAPDVVVLLDSVQHVTDAFFASPNERETFAARAVDRIVGRWRAIEDRCGAVVVQSNLVTPLARPFGNYEHKVQWSLTDTIATINRELSMKAREHKSVFVNDAEYIAAYVGKKSWFDEKRWVLSKSYCALEHLPLVAKNIVDIVMASRGAGIKCVILDLDNTLWGGVVGDDGLDGIRLGHLGEGEAFVSFQRFLLELSRRGVLLAVCSKNNRETALSVFREHPDMILREKDITMFVANWDDKATNIGLIRDAIGVGFDSMLFLDDSPFERDLVRSRLPEVIVPDMPEDPADFVSALSERNWFETSTFSSVDRERGELYRSAAKREELRGSVVGIDEYLRSLEMECDVRRFDEFSLGRIAQLIQRSNQFNLATRRYSEAQCAAMMRDAQSWCPIAVKLRDRFGDYGLVGVVVVKLSGARATIEEYLMSCRVLQRGVEQYVMNSVVSEMKRQGVARIEGIYVPTKKNMMVSEFYRTFGFERLDGEGGGTVRWELSVDSYEPRATTLRPHVAASE